jgi:hypothetical protein
MKESVSSLAADSELPNDNIDSQRRQCDYNDNDPGIDFDAIPFTSNDIEKMKLDVNLNVNLTIYFTRKQKE